MPRLPLLIGIRSLSNLEKLMVILCRLLVGAQVIVGRSTQEIADRDFGQKFSTSIGGPDRQLIVLVLVRGAREIAVRGPEVRLELHRRQEFLLGIRKL